MRMAKEDIPRITRQLFPLILEEHVRAGELGIVVTDTEIAITNAVAPDLGVYRAAETSVALAQLPRSTSGSFRGI